MHPIGYGQTDVGRRRERNEDSHDVDDDLGLYLVCDGMGGHAAGEVASAAAVAAIRSAIVSQMGEIRSASGEVSTAVLSRAVEGAILNACREVYELARSTEGRAGMGCTATVLLIAGNKAIMGHVGDSRLYLARAGTVSQVSSDHTMANELAMLGMIEPSEVKSHHYAHVLTRAVGTQEAVQVDTLAMDILPGDVFLLCSDGLSDYIDDDVWIGQQLLGAEHETVAEELISYANAAGGEDNITAVIVRIDADLPEQQIVDEMSVEISHRFDALGSTFLFEGLSMALLTRVLNACEVEEIEPGEVVLEQGELCDRLVMITEGRCLVVRDGAEVGALGAGSYLAATTLLNPRELRATLRADCRARVLSLGTDAFRRLVKERPWLGVGLLERLARRLGDDLDRSIERRGGSDPSPSEAF